MPYITSYPMLVSTLGPVHVGDGQDIEPGEYLIRDQVLYEIPHDRLGAALNERQRQQLNQILLQQDGPNMLLDVQRFFRNNAETFLPVASHAVPVSAELARFYDTRLGKVQQGPGRKGGSATANKLEIQRQVRNPVTQQPYLPGSSLKGAIRTAVLDALNQGEKSRVDRATLEKQLLGYRKVDEDPFKFLKVSDAQWVSDNPPQDILFAVNRPKKTGKQSQAEQRGLYSILECLGPARGQALAGDIRLVRPSQQTAAGKGALQDIRQLARLCNRFYLPMLEKELDRFEARGFLDRYCFDESKNWANAVRKLLAGPIRSRLDNGSAFLLRVGRHGGAESNTLSGTRQIKIMRGRGEKPLFLSSPLTDWLAATERNARTALLPFGWILVELVDEQHPPEPTLGPLLNTLNEKRYQQHREVQDGLQQRAEQWQAEQAQARREAEEKAARAKAEAEAEAQREAALQAMSEPERKVHALQMLFERQQQAGIRDQSGELRVVMTETVQLVAAAGDDALKDRLDALAREICAFWGASLKKNKKLKELVRSIKNS